MGNISIESQDGINEKTLKEALFKSLDGKKLKKVLLIPPDYTRMHSGAGLICSIYYSLLKNNCQIDIMPAVGTHDPLSETECRAFYGSEIPFSSILVHNWRKDIIKIGEIPTDYVSTVSGGLWNKPIDVELNKVLLDSSYDLIISIGQVVPHEIAGMANYSKNILVGCGGSSMINQTHMLGAVCGMENIMGKDHTPVRKVFDYAEQNSISHLPLMYVLTVTTQHNNSTIINGLYIGRDRQLFESAAALSQKLNITLLDKPVQTILVWLDQQKYKSTWLGNKAIYRTRMAIADGGELVIFAPGVKKFGEDPENDRLIRKYGYAGTREILDLCSEQKELEENLSAAAHLIHGSTEGRFSVTYCTKELSKAEVESVGFNYMPFETALAKYGISQEGIPAHIQQQSNDILFINNPATGLWACADKYHFGACP